MDLHFIIRDHNYMKPFQLGEKLQCKMEHRNVRHSQLYSFVVADIIVRHLPRNISIPCYLILHKGVIVSCFANGVSLTWPKVAQPDLSSALGIIAFSIVAPVQKRIWYGSQGKMVCYSTCPTEILGRQLAVCVKLATC